MKIYVTSSWFGFRKMYSLDIKMQKSFSVNISLAKNLVEEKNNCYKTAMDNQCDIEQTWPWCWQIEDQLISVWLTMFSPGFPQWFAIYLGEQYLAFFSQKTSVSYSQKTSVSYSQKTSVSYSQKTSVSYSQKTSVSYSQKTSVSCSQKTSVS